MTKQKFQMHTCKDCGKTWWERSRVLTQCFTCGAKAHKASK